MLLTRVKKDTCVTESVSHLCSLPVSDSHKHSLQFLTEKGDMPFMSKRKDLERQRWQEKKNNQSLLFPSWSFSHDTETQWMDDHCMLNSLIDVCSLLLSCECVFLSWTCKMFDCPGERTRTEGPKRTCEESEENPFVHQSINPSKKERG